MVQLVARHVPTDVSIGDLDDGEYFRRLSIWIEMYLETTEPHTSQWWDMYYEERAIWEEFPSLVESLLKRR